MGKGEKAANRTVAVDRWVFEALHAERRKGETLNVVIRRLLGFTVQMAKRGRPVVPYTLWQSIDHGRGGRPIRSKIAVEHLEWEVAQEEKRKKKKRRSGQLK